MERLKSSAVLGGKESERYREKGNLPTNSFTLTDMETRTILKGKKSGFGKRSLTYPHPNTKQIQEYLLKTLRTRSGLKSRHRESYITVDM